MLFFQRGKLGTNNIREYGQLVTLVNAQSNDFSGSDKGRKI